MALKSKDSLKGEFPVLTRPKYVPCVKIPAFTAWVKSIEAE